MRTEDFDRWLAAFRKQVPWLPGALALHYGRLYGTRAVALLEGAKDQSGRTLGMPIKDAMEKFVAEQNAKASAKNSAQSVESYDDQLPTAASSGRVSMKGKQ